MRSNGLLILLFVTSLVSAAQTRLFSPGEVLTLPVSSNNPNLIMVPGDRVTALTSAGGTLNGERLTPSGAVLFSSDTSRPFTLFVETGHGQTITVQAKPQKGAGRSYRLLSAEPLPAASLQGKAHPYEALLAGVNRTVLAGKTPQGWLPAAILHDRLPAPSGMTLTAEDAWSGETLRLVRYRLRNVRKQAVNLNEADLWQPGVRAVMFAQPVTRLLPRASVVVYVTLAREVRS